MGVAVGLGAAVGLSVGPGVNVGRGVASQAAIRIKPRTTTDIDKANCFISLSLLFFR
jgi:hypothetical protein